MRWKTKACYTLRPTLAKVAPKLIVPNLTAGILKDKLDVLTDAQKYGKTNLALSDAVSNDNFLGTSSNCSALGTFLSKNLQITDVDLSQVTGLTELVYTFYSRSNLKKFTLPESVTTIGASIISNASTQIFLPNITTEEVTKGYQSGFTGKSVYYDYKGSGDKTDPANYNA